MKQRSFLFYAFVLFVFFLLAVRLCYLQVYKDNDLLNIYNSSIKRIALEAERGAIFDRHGKLLVSNTTYYKLMAIPQKIAALDTMRLCRMLGVDKDFLVDRLNKARRWSPLLPSVIMAQIPKERYAILQSNISHFKGFFIKKQSLRKHLYPYASNIIGYLREVNQHHLNKDESYALGDIVGVTGVESYYEKHLRGVKGISYFQYDKYNRIINSYKEGQYDVSPKMGKSLTLTIDAPLQAYATELMKGKRGGVVAIEPNTGEILAAVSTPTYHPQLMVGSNARKEINKLLSDKEDKPFFDRALQANYPPGSTFKILQGLIGLQEGIIDEKTKIKCYHGHRYGRGSKAFMGCHCGTNGRGLAYKEALKKSCNTYFATVYRSLLERDGDAEKGIDLWSGYLEQFGLGRYLGYDLAIGSKGLVPNAALYDSWYPNGWRSTFTISNAIGQGQLLVTPIQLANMTAAIANRGFFYRPHFVKSLAGKSKADKFKIKQKIAIDSVHFETVIGAMSSVFRQGGTAYYSRIRDIEMCGKTGTVQNYKLVNGQKVEMPDHAIFVAFAPREHPKIAVSIYIENGGYGSTIAAPMASLIIERYLKGAVVNKWRDGRIKKKDLTAIYQRYANFNK